MLDIKLLRDNIDAVAKELARRGFKLDIDKFNDLENKRKTLQTRTQELQNQRNTQAKQIGMAKSKGEDIAALLKQTENMGEELKTAEADLAILLADLDSFLAGVPNILDSSVPDKQEIIRTWGEPRKFDFEIKDHVDLGQNLGLMDFESATKITGTRFVVLKNNLVKLHRALINFMIDTHTKEHNYQEIYVPYIVNAESLFGTTQLPKFKEDLFKLDTEQDYYLIPTAEVPVTNMARGKIFAENELPQRWTAHTPCFRSEAGSYGKDTRGMIRQHQFEKVELVHLCKPEESKKIHEELVSHAEKILQKLNLPYRVVVLAADDTGFGAAKTYDLEVWLPSQNTYREISSCSNTESFQARRMQARYKNSQTNKTEFIHTLNGSGLAVGRTLVAILENCQDKDGHIHVPDVLVPYMGGIKII
ncbi:MAG TPA: serine--tRNA ligase [Gammaproteobacteria bacterium]|nr:serine--tRNA ligase [Gammaproteobacteria bacterium]